MHTIAFFVLAAVLGGELLWLKAIDRRANRLADRYVEGHLGASDLTELVRAQRLAVGVGAMCLLALVVFVAGLVNAKGWLDAADLFLIIVFLPLSTGFIRVAKRIKEEVQTRTGVG